MNTLLNYVSDDAMALILCAIALLVSFGLMNLGHFIGHGSKKSVRIRKAREFNPISSSRHLTKRSHVQEQSSSSSV